MNFNFLTNLFSSKKIAQQEYSLFRKQNKVVVRIAPSPTGLLHLGTARTALFNYLFAKKHGGRFIVRVEDTDKERSKKGYEDDILEGLTWLGIIHDELFRQSERTEIYTSYLKKLVASGKAFISKEESTQNQGAYIEVVRLKNSGEKITFMDEIRGEITFDTTDLGDFVIARTLTEPLYHLAVVVDDYEMDVTHVIRGEDHISNTPRQILIQRALGFREPKYAHIPLILASDRSKMSKRKGSTSISEYRENGYVKEALINYLAFLGWNPGTEKEVYSLEELINDFSLEQVQKGGAVFDIQKLNWFNQQHLRALPPKEFMRLLEEQQFENKLKQLPRYSDEKYERVIKVESERVSTLKELEELIKKGELDYYFDSPKIEAKLTWKGEGGDTAKKHLDVVIKKLQTLSENAFTADTVKETLWGYAEEVGKGSVLWPMRVALSGKEKSPDPFTLSEILGKEETINRIKNVHKSF